MTTMTTPLWGSDRNDWDTLGFRALTDPHAAITRGQYNRARGTARDLIANVIDRLTEDEAVRIFRFSESELAILANLERTAT